MNCCTTPPQTPPRARGGVWGNAIKLRGKYNLFLEPSPLTPLPVGEGQG